MRSFLVGSPQEEPDWRKERLALAPGGRPQDRVNLSAEPMASAQPLAMVIQSPDQFRILRVSRHSLTSTSLLSSPFQLPIVLSLRHLSTSLSSKSNPPTRNRNLTRDMNAQQDAQPRLMSGVRRFGRYEKFQDISNNPSGHASIGGKSVGKINIDCQFAFKQSQWGVLGDDECPVGVLYMNLNFSPPLGCKLKSATVTITLDDEDPCLTTYKLARPEPSRTTTPVQITDWYGPKQLAGQARTIDKTRFKQFIPEANFMGNGGGGVGAGSETSFRQSARWLFSGQLLPGKKTRIYKTLRWDLVENELEKQPSRSNRVYTAFSFVHSGQPFLMKVDVDGRLEKWDKQVLSKLSFGNAKKKVRDTEAVTLIDFAEFSKFQRRLDNVVYSLPRAMEMKNFQEIAPVVPEPVEVTFAAVSPSVSQTEEHFQIPPTIRVEEVLMTSHPNVIAGNEHQQHLLPEPTQQPQPWTPETGTAPSIEDLTQMMQSISSTPDRQSLRENTPTPSTEDTLVGSTSDDGPGEPQNMLSQENAPGPKEDAQEDAKGVIQIKVLDSSNHPDPESVIKLFQIPALFGVFRLLISLMSLLGYLPAAEPGSADGDTGRGQEEEEITKDTNCKRPTPSKPPANPLVLSNNKRQV